jgi:hypothetical protein
VDGDRTTFGIGKQAVDDLRIAGPFIARVSESGQWALPALEVSRSQIVEDQRSVGEVLACELGFEGGLPLEEPIHGLIQVVLRRPG